MSEQRAEILLPTYNGARYIREQIDSILAQTDGRWHLTLSDDGSTDGTQAILDEYAQQYPDKIARYRSGRRFGNARDHFFHLMQRCDAPYMLFCDQDDVWYPQKVGRTMDALLAAEAEGGKDTPVLVFSDQRVTDAQLRPLSDSLAQYQRHYTDHFDYRSLLMQNVVTGGAMGINRALAKLGGNCADPSQTIMHDWWLAAVAARFGKVVYLPEPLGDYRQHGDNEVGAKNVTSTAYVARRLSNLADVKKTIRNKKLQAAVFLKTYAASLGAEDNRFLQGFVRERSGALFCWRYRRLVHGLWRFAGMLILG